MIKRGSIFIGAQKDDFLSGAIRKVSSSNWSHCAIITDSTDFESYVFGARGRGVDLCTLTEYDSIDKYYYRIYEIDMPEFAIDKVLRETVDTFLEKPYGYFQLAVGFPIWFALKDWLGITLPFNPVSFWTVCSELDAVYMKALLTDRFPELKLWNKDLITPENIFQFVEKHPEIFKRVKEKKAL